MAIVCPKIRMHTPKIFETTARVPLVLSFNEEGIACLQCTFINAYGAKTCAMCFSPLPQKTRKNIVMAERLKTDIKSPTPDTPEVSSATSASAANVAVEATSKPAATTKKAWGGWKKSTTQKPKQVSLNAINVFASQSVCPHLFI